MSGIENNKNKILFICLVVFIFVFFFVLNELTPYVGDDFAHYFGMTGEHCNTIGGIFRDMKTFRETTNGRIIPHFFVYLFLMFPKYVFNIFNSIMATLFATLVFRFYNDNFSKKSIWLFICEIMLLWSFAPNFGKVYLWLSGSCNYLWNLVVDMLFIYPFFICYLGRENKKIDNSVGLKVLYMFVAFVAGASSENAATAILAFSGMIGILLIIEKRKIPLYLIVAYLVCVAGFGFLMLAPATINTKTSVNLFENIKTCIIGFRKYSLALFLTFVLLFTIGIVRKVNYRILSVSAIFVAAGLISIAVFVFAAYIPPRSYNVMAVYTTLACLLLLKELIEHSNKIILIAAMICITIFFGYKFASGTADIVSLAMQASRREATIENALNTGKREVTLAPYASRTLYTAVIEEELSEDPEFWYNDLVAKYYGLGKIKAAKNEETN